MRRYHHTHAAERGSTEVTARGAVVGLACIAVVVVGLLAVTAPVATGWTLLGAVAALAGRRVAAALGRRRSGRTPSSAVRATATPKA